MKKEKIVLSLIIMVVLILGLTISSFATGESGSITITPKSSTNNGTTISANNSAVAADDNEVGDSENSTRISANSANNSATVGASSSYRNTASNIAEEADSLPYTGTSYGVVFVIIALVVSAVYAYKKVSDYNM